MYILEDIESCRAERVPEDVQNDQQVDHVTHSGKENLCFVLLN